MFSETSLKENVLSSEMATSKFKIQFSSRQKDWFSSVKEKYKKTRGKNIYENNRLYSGSLKKYKYIATIYLAIKDTF